MPVAALFFLGILLWTGIKLIKFPFEVAMDDVPASWRRLLYLLRAMALALALRHVPYYVTGLCT